MHEEDGLGALLAAVRSPVRGAVNVASPGTIGLTAHDPHGRPRAAAAGRPRCSAPPRARSRRAGLPSLSPDFLRLLRYGRAVDTTRLVERSASRPRYTTPVRDGGVRRSPPERGGSAPARGRRRGHRLPARRCARAWTRAWSCPRRWCAPPASLPGGAKKALSRLDGRYTEDEWGFDEDFARAVEPLFDFLYDQLVARAGHRGGEGARPRPRAAGRQPRRHPALGRDDDVDRAPARAPPAALPALPGPGLGLPAALGLDRHPQGRRRGGLALQRPPAAGGRPARGRVPRGGQGHRQALLRALPAPALRPRRVRGAGPAHRRADRAGGGGGQRGDLPDAGPVRRWPPGSCARPTSR